MGSLFDARVLDDLPPRIQTAAKRFYNSPTPFRVAADPSFLETARGPQHILLLPLYWKFLDPERILSPEELTDASPSGLRRMAMITLSISGSYRALEQNMVPNTMTIWKPAYRRSRKHSEADTNNRTLL
ncbi:hypothetical protein MKEN_00202500 [Mycena kentingensis (nom. inval.)]|nr:hypothetical protein MKEN_00202500 [Mycena kentingensis (nom. inval.)]